MCVCVCVFSSVKRALAQIIMNREYKFWTIHQGTESKPFLWRQLYCERVLERQGQQRFHGTFKLAYKLSSTNMPINDPMP